MAHPLTFVEIYLALHPVKLTFVEIYVALHTHLITSFKIYVAPCLASEDLASGRT